MMYVRIGLMMKPSSNLLGICFSSTMPEFPIRKAKWVLIRE
jgi:hypothetical protein